MNIITEYLTQYLAGLEQIKQDLKAIEEEAAGIPNVEKRPFKAIAAAMHAAPGTTTEKLNGMERFIELTFAKDDGKQAVIQLNKGGKRHEPN